MEPIQRKKEYDIIFAGGGTAACVAAGRLAAAAPTLAILIIESGPNNLNDQEIVTPARFPKHLLPGSKTAKVYQGTKEAALHDRAPAVPVGNVLGGGSSINFMTYVRAQARDFDSWATEGWRAKDLIPLAKKAETYHAGSSESDLSTHGTNGPIHVSQGTYGSTVHQDDVLAAAESVAYTAFPDLQDFKSCNGFSRFHRYISPDGRRQDVAHAYIHPLLDDGKHPNLHLAVESRVLRVIFDGTRATGVEYAAGEDVNIVNASRLVVVAAGTLGTPPILERSGVGDAKILENLGIKVVADVPGVGEGFNDHTLMGYGYKTSLRPGETMDELFSGRLDLATATDEQKKILHWNGMQVSGKIRPSEAEVAQLGPEFQALWDRDYKNDPEKPLILVVVGFGHMGPRHVLPANDAEQYVTMACYTPYPYSRGSVHITSRDDNPPRLTTGYLSEPADIKVHLWAYKKQRDIFRRTNAYAGELEARHPKFRKESNAVLRNDSERRNFTSVEDRRNIKPINYDDEDDAAIEDWIRKSVNTMWHSVGTCKMAPGCLGGVVDKNLNVYGTNHLKVADLSICPQQVAANTYNTALIIGEKAATIIADELGVAL